jgi:hypothetical protein
MVLHPTHGGAVLEFGSATAAGKAALAVDGLEVEGGRKLRTGTVAGLFRSKAEKRVDRVDKPAAAPSSAAAGGGAGEKSDSKKGTTTGSSTAAQLMPPPPLAIRRPTTQGPRAGPKRVLGFVRAVPAAAKSGGGDSAGQDGVSNGDEKGQAGGKSNADFKRLFLGQGKKDENNTATAGAGDGGAAGTGEVDGQDVEMTAEGNGNKAD